MSAYSSACFTPWTAVRTHSLEVSPEQNHPNIFLATSNYFISLFIRSSNHMFVTTATPVLSDD